MLCAAAVVCAVALGVSAAAPEKECLDPPPPQPVPPVEAFDACLAHAEGAACVVMLPDQLVAGVCVPDLDRALFCRPFTPPPPPPEAFAACEGLAFGDACGIPLECGVVRGTCDSTPRGELFCRPPFAPRL